ncbi:MAG: aminotransferase class I/II-fold pyridoxal phosphate-dependent enzyme [Ignavibacteriales bacterium]|nr:MAG: aminotransferase class I/II-fold pyridoxal phosphate-dependent enzyme [Ignavibacteriales bacterium]
MSYKKLEKVLIEKVTDLKTRGVAKGKEKVVTKIKLAENEKGPRFFIEGFGEKEFLRMNSNSYLGMSLRKEIIEAEEEAAKKYGAGPGAVRFISGTYKPHTDLEEKLAKFHSREAAMIFSSAYATIVSVISSLIDNETIVISDELNHNCIINAIKLARPKVKDVYKHLDMNLLEETIKKSIGQGKRVLIITDGIFSMRGDYAPLDKISTLAEKYDKDFEEGVITIVDDSHGVGAFGKTGRGTIEYTNAKGIDILIGTLGKAFGVNGGYVTASAALIEYFRESSPMYIYSNPITTAEACAAMKSLEIVDSGKGVELLDFMRAREKQFEQGLIKLGYEVIESEHPVVPLMLRDTKTTSDCVHFLVENGILATGLNYPVVPKGDEEIRFQISADHTEYDINYALDVLKQFKKTIS